MKISRIAWYGALLLSFAVNIGCVTDAVASGGQVIYFPRLANFYYTNAISEYEARQLAKWDLVVMGQEVPYESNSEFRLIGQLNPSIKLLVYLNSISRIEQIPSTPPDHPAYRTRIQTHDAWLLKSAAGESMGFWPGAQVLNPTTFAPLIDNERWQDFVPRTARERLNTGDGWNGIFFDDAMSTISWLNNGIIDINNDGLNDQVTYIDAQWQLGMKELFRKTRIQLGEAAVIVTNSSSTYQEYTNGRLYESSFRGTDGWWDQIIDILNDLRYQGAQHRMVIINANTNNDGDWQDWRRFRYAYASTLMTDAYFSFDFGDKWHQQLWWFDEYDVDLGKALSTGTQIIRHGEEDTKLGVWRRDFEYGTAIVNNSPTSYTVTLDGKYRKITGTQDRAVNNGARVTSVTVPPFDGLVIIRETARQQEVIGPIVRSYRAEFPMNNAVSQAFIAGSRISITDAETGTALETRVYQSAALPSGTFGLSHDMDHDGSFETVIWDYGVLTLKKGGKTVWSMRPYDQQWRGYVSMAAGDIDGDGISEIVLAAGPGGGPHVRIVSAYGTHKSSGFFADDKRKRNGAYVTLGDINYDGIQDIIVGSGAREQPWIKSFSINGTVIEHLPVRRIVPASGARITSVVQDAATHIGIY